MLRRIGRLAKHLVLGASEITGLSKFVEASSWRRERLLILCYHGASLIDEHIWDSELFVTPEFLRRRMMMLREHNCSVLPLGEAVERLGRGDLPPKSVAVTFDDGFHNFHAAAAPILSEFRIPATVYVSTYHCIEQRPVLRLAMRYLLWRSRHQVVSSILTVDRDLSGDLSSSLVREKLAAALYSKAHALCTSDGQQQAFLETVASSLGIDWTEFLRARQFHLMTAEEVGQVARQGIDIELHTHRHRTPRNRIAFEYEISENSRIIGSVAGRVPEHFCYPSGDYDLQYLDWLAAAGVKSATTCEVGLAGPKHHLLLLPRFIDTMGQSRWIFRAWLSGAAEFLATSRPITLGPTSGHHETAS